MQFRLLSLVPLCSVISIFCETPTQNVAIQEPNITALAYPEGIEVSGWNPEHIDWKALHIQFAYIKATEGTTYRNPKFLSQYTEAYKAGLIRGAYHSARPDGKSREEQARYFVQHGGGWSKDGKTLPGMLDLDSGPNGKTCYGLSHTAMVQWIRAFSNEYHKTTSRHPVIRISLDWWKQCTGNNGSFGDSALFVARGVSTPAPLPNGWKRWTFREYKGRAQFNGNVNDLKKFALG
ncbi:hypothetical protein FRB99_006248, partial [Tulasnella sp. 403]